MPWHKLSVLLLLCIPIFDDHVPQFSFLLIRHFWEFDIQFHSIAMHISEYDHAPLLIGFDWHFDAEADANHQEHADPLHLY